MTANWKVFPPWTSEQGSTTISPGSPIRNDFTIVKHRFDLEMTTCFHWSDLSRGDVANLRNLISNEDLRALVRSYGYGISWGTSVDMESEQDPNDAAFDLMIDSKEDLPETLTNEIVNFISSYKVSRSDISIQ